LITCVNVGRHQSICLDDAKRYLLKKHARREQATRIAKLIPYFKKYCRKCAHPLPLSWRNCKAHDERLEHVDATLAAGLYYTRRVREELGLSNVLTGYILGAKQSKSYIPLLAAAMALVVKEKVYGVGIDDIDIVTFVPKHDSELKRDIDDGTYYNQAELLAKWVAQHLGLKAVEIVEKLRPLSLAGLDVWERYRIASEVYRLKSDARGLVEDKRVLLVDDVRTSGATANTIARLLKDAGAKRVYLLVAGRATHYDTMRKIIEEYAATKNKIRRRGGS